MVMKDDFKARIIQAGWTMSDVVQELNTRYGRNDSLQNLSGKLSRGTLKYREAEEIADIIGFEIVWQKRESYT